jgi:hypothetical protein
LRFPVSPKIMMDGDFCDSKSGHLKFFDHFNANHSAI